VSSRRVDRPSVSESVLVHRLVPFLLLALAGRPAPASAQLEVQAFLGSSVSAPSPLSIHQQGQPDLSFTAHWATRPFLDTWYYAGRIGLWKGNRAWLLDFTHHKVYLTNPPAEVQRFAVTNGMNMLTVSRGFRRGRLTYAVGAGPVITYPVTRVRGEMLQDDRGFLGGYFLSGGNLMASITRRLPLAAGIFLSLDGRVSATYVRIPVAHGHAGVPNAALHLHAGLGYQAEPSRAGRKERTQ
jgi:hypothetical protein